MNKEVVSLDKEFDGCQDVWVTGEAHGFFTESFLAEKDSYTWKSSLVV